MLGEGTQSMKLTEKLGDTFSLNFFYFSTEERELHTKKTIAQHEMKLVRGRGNQEVSIGFPMFPLVL
jgi:hypothetical protein